MAKVIAAALVALAVIGAGVYAVTQYRASRADVVATLAAEPYFYDEVPLAPLDTLADADQFAQRLRDAAEAAAPDRAITAEYLAVEDSGEWNRVLKVSTGSLRRFGFTTAPPSTSPSPTPSTSRSDTSHDALFAPDGALRRLFDARTVAVVAIPAGPDRFALGFFEMS